MTNIRVDPTELAKAAEELARLSERIREIGNEAYEVGAAAPSYDGQFGPQVERLGLDALSALSSQSQRVGLRGDELREISQAFAEADSQSEGGIIGLGGLIRDWLDRLGIRSSPGTPSAPSMWAVLDRRLGLGGLLVGDRDSTDDDGWNPDPWLESLLLKANAGWGWFEQEIGLPIRETIYGAPEQWSQNAEYARTIVLLSLAIGWRKFDEGIGQPFRDTIEQLPVRQEPGLPGDGPITGAMQFISRVDDDGNPVSIVGSELAGLIDDRGGVSIMFSDNLTNGGTAGVAPVKGLVWLPEAYESRTEQMELGKASLIAHELDHILQRDLREFPTGLPSVSFPFSGAGSWPFGPEGFQPIASTGLYGFPIVGDFTLYMEVQSNIVAEAIKYDLLADELSNLQPGTFEYVGIEGRMGTIQNVLATFTGDPENAVAFVVDRQTGRDPHGMYLGEFVREVAAGGRIPPGGWQFWLEQQGFSQAAIGHIEEVAQGGIAHDVPIADFLREGSSPHMTSDLASEPKPTHAAVPAPPAQTPVPPQAPGSATPTPPPESAVPPGTPAP
ncbi:MAG: hypothetical protein ACC700_10180 [Anaerolineales bacterium]